MIYTQEQLLMFYAATYNLNKAQLACDFGVTRRTIYDWLYETRQMPLIYKKYIALDLSIATQFLDFDFQPSIPVYPLTKQRLHDLPF